MAEKIAKEPLLHPFTLLDTAWKAYSKKIPFFTKLVLAPTLFYLVLDTLSYVADHGVSSQPMVLLAQSVSYTLPLTIFLYLIAFILQTFSTAALLASLINPKITSVSVAYQEGTQKILSLWWISILSFLIVSGGFILFIIPGIIFSIWFTFAQYVLFKEEKRGVHALLQSREYVKGYFWQILGRILFIAVIAAALSSISGYVSVLFNNGLLSQIAQSFVSLIIVPLVMFYQYLLYENARSLKGEGVIKKTPWWMYVVGSLVPFVLVIVTITLFLIIKPLHVSNDAMMPNYKKGAFLLWGTSPVNTHLVNDPVIYKKGQELTVRRVFAGPGDRVERKGDMLMLSGNTSPNSNTLGRNTPFAVELAISSFIPRLTLLGDTNSYTLKKDEYIMVADNFGNISPNWELVNKDRFVGVPYICVWSCTGKE